MLLEQGIFPSKRLGQNFLVNKWVLKKILKASELSGEDKIIEIGAGTGILTVELAKHAKEVFAIEKDTRLLNILKERLKEFQNVKILEGDIKDLLDGIIEGLPSFKIIGNIPYYLTGFLMRRIIEWKKRPEMMVLMVQREVAERLIARVPRMNFLGLIFQYIGTVKIEANVKRSSFWPLPKVDGAIVKFLFRKENPLYLNELCKVAKAGFSHPRKTLANNLSSMLKLEKRIIYEWCKRNSLPENIRADALHVRYWLNLLNFLQENGIFV